MILDSGEVDFSVSEGAGLGISSRALGGTDFDNQTTFRSCSPFYLWIEL